MEIADAPGGRASAAKGDEGSFTSFLLKLVLIVLAVRIFIVAPFSIPSESMMPTLLRGDFLIAAKWPYGWSRLSVPFDLPLIPGRIKAAVPERGDVVIFRHPLEDADYIKRAVGLPGDTVAMADGALILNGRTVRRERIADALIPATPYASCAGAERVADDDSGTACRYRRFRETLPGGRSYEVLDFGRSAQDDFAPVTVPAGHLFVLGDNRDNSLDSRFAAADGGVGMVDQRLLVGRAALVAFSVDGSAEWTDPASWFSAVRWDRTGTRL